MKKSQAFPSRLLGKEDLAGPTVGIIGQVVIETIGQGEEQETKPILYFTSGLPKPMVINTTNWLNVSDLYGEDSDDWTGKPIEVWVDPSVSFGGKRTGGLRLRAPSNGNSHSAMPINPTDYITLFWSHVRANNLDGAALLGKHSGDFEAACRELNLIFPTAA